MQKWFLIAVFLVACQQEDIHLETKKPYKLKVWPDSAYLASVQAELKIDTSKAKGGATFVDQVEQKKTDLLLGEIPESVRKALGIKAAEAQQERKEQETLSTSPLSAEAFAQKFMERAQALHADPQNSAYFRTVQVTAADQSWDALLTRVYGPGIKSVPSMLRSQAIQDLNPGVSQPAAGQTVKVPQL